MMADPFVGQLKALRDLFVMTDPATFHRPFVFIRGIELERLPIRRLTRLFRVVNIHNGAALGATEITYDQIVLVFFVNIMITAPDQFSSAVPAIHCG